jgi:thiol-disulfide isomerase/thioredoxin
MNAKNILLLAMGSIACFATPIFAGEFPDDWTWDDKPEQRAAHVALEGKPMPAFHVSDWINGGITAADIKGKVIVVDLYATWCPPCMRAIPHNNELLKKYKDAGLVIIGVCTSDSGQEIFADNAKQHDMQYPAALDPELKTEKAWAVQYYPTYAIIDRKGIVRVVGLRPDHVEEVVQKLLAEPAP